MARTVIAACLVVALAYGMYHRLETAGVFLETAPKNDGACQLLTGAAARIAANATRPPVLLPSN